MEAALSMHAIKKLAGMKLSDNAKKLASKRFIHMAALYPYLLHLMEEYVFVPYSVGAAEIKALSDTIYQDAKRVNDYESIGAVIGFSQSKISKIERGDWDSLSDLRLIAKVLEIPIEDLVRDESD